MKFSLHKRKVASFELIIHRNWVINSKFFNFINFGAYYKEIISNRKGILEIQEKITNNRNFKLFIEKRICLRD